MKRLLLISTFAIIVSAQWLTVSAQKLTFGYLNYTQVLHSMADYATAQTTMQSIREQYDKEATYNEDKFFKMYSEYIQGQKTFPEDIMLKRQKELQVAMDQGLQFRKESEKLLQAAEAELMAPVQAKLDSAIAVVARDRELAFVLNTEAHACPFINPTNGVDITPLVNLVLAGHPLPKADAVAPAVQQTAAKPADEQ